MADGFFEALRLLCTSGPEDAEVALETRLMDRDAKLLREVERALSKVEDDTYGFLCADPPPPLVSFAPELGYFLTGTSKNLTAGLRIGYLLVPAADGGAAALLERIESNVAALTWMRNNTPEPLGDDEAYYFPYETPTAESKVTVSYKGSPTTPE